MATIQLGPYKYSDSSGSYSSYVTLTYSEETLTSDDKLNNVSRIKCTVETSGNRSKNNVTTAFTVNVTGCDKWTAIPAASYNSHQYKSYTFTVPHDENGAKTVTVSFSGNIYTTSGSPTTSNSAQLTLTTIPRGHKFSLNKTMLTSGQSVTITATKSVSSYTSTITWSNGTNSGTIANKNTGTSWTATYATLSAGLASGVNRTITFTCTTYNGNTAVQTSTLSLVLSTGVIDLSLYHESDGLGCKWGSRAEGPGYYFPLGDAIKIVTATTSYKLTANGECSITVPITVPSGYTAIGVLGYDCGVGITGSGCSCFNVYKCMLSSATTALVVGRRIADTGITPSANTTITVKVLCIYTG